MDFLKRMNKVIYYIEEHITEDIEFGEVSKIVCCNIHQFTGIFSYVSGISLSEYVRRRRLSFAALELQKGKSKVIDIALKYGYDSPEAFARAFRDMHGIAPREAFNPGVRLKLYPKITFHISIKGDTDMEYRIEEKEAITLVGKISKMNGSNDGDIWREFFRDGTNAKLLDNKLYRPPFWQMGVYMIKDDKTTEIAIGAEARGEVPEGLEVLVIPARTWAVFTVTGKPSREMAKMHTRIETEWLPSSGYTHIFDYEIENFPPGNPDAEDYKTEIWIPVVKKQG